MKYLIFAFIVTFSLIHLLPDYLYAQKYRQNLLGIRMGISDFHLFDEHASPLFFSGIGIAPSIQYYRKNKNSIHAIEASFYRNKLKTTQDNFVTQNYSGRFRYSYSYGFNLIPAKQNLKLYLGGSIHSFFNKSDYDYKYFNIPNARAITSWYWSHSLDLSAQLEYFFASGDLISGGLYIPVISNVSRPEYSPSGDYNYTTNDWDIPILGETAFFLKNTGFNAFINYQRPISAKFNLQLSYEFYYAAYFEPRDIKMYMNTVRVGLFYCF